MKRPLLSTVFVLLAGFVGFQAAYRIRFARLARLYPHDGQIGVDALLVGAIASIAAALMAMTAVLLFARMREGTSADSQEQP